MRPEEEHPFKPEARSGPARLDGLLDALARRSGWGRRLEGARVHGLWAQIAGEQLAAHAEPVRLQGGVLVIRADSAMWATQVRYLSSDIAQRANQVLGAQPVKRVSVVTGPLKGTSDAQSDP
ncbi:MAG TPA: DUF721 domain-containing protein [Egibacteraceae bacterium]|nr:DUF721 domain-containing protein [Egibacteraceae bacterium]